MTPQEASEELKEEFEIFKDGIDPKHWENPNKELRKIIEANTIAIEVLGQEPCEDAVSRNAITRALNEMDRYVANELTLCDTDKKFPQNEVFIVDDVYEQIVEQLPSVTPQPKTGRWIPDDTICEDTLYRCSNCDNVYYSDYGDVKDMGYKYCPNCGAKMESEVRDV